jgi:hypothetical protein
VSTQPPNQESYQDTALGLTLTWCLLFYLGLIFIYFVGLSLSFKAFILLRENVFVPFHHSFILSDFDA